MPRRRLRLLVRLNREGGAIGRPGVSCYVMWKDSVEVVEDFVAYTVQNLFRRHVGGGLNPVR